MKVTAPILSAFALCISLLLAGDGVSLASTIRLNPASVILNGSNPGVYAGEVSYTKGNFIFVIDGCEKWPDEPGLKSVYFPDLPRQEKITFQNNQSFRLIYMGTLYIVTVSIVGPKIMVIVT